MELLLSSDMVVEEEHQWPAHFEKFEFLYVYFPVLLCLSVSVK